MERRKWVMGANGLWWSYDRGIARQKARERGRQRVLAIRERLKALIKRDGWKRRNGVWKRNCENA